MHHLRPPERQRLRCEAQALPKRLGGNQKRKRDAQVIARHGNRCAGIDADGRCAATTGLQIDHLIPRTTGRTRCPA